MTNKQKDKWKSRRKDNTHCFSVATVTNTQYGFIKLYFYFFFMYVPQHIYMYILILPSPASLSYTDCKIPLYSTLSDCGWSGTRVTMNTWPPIRCTAVASCKSILFSFLWYVIIVYTTPYGEKRVFGEKKKKNEIRNKIKIIVKFNCVCFFI